jgi:hypothetical protein
LTEANQAPLILDYCTKASCTTEKVSDFAGMLSDKIHWMVEAIQILIVILPGFIIMIMRNFDQSKTEVCKMKLKKVLEAAVLA